MRKSIIIFGQKVSIKYVDLTDNDYDGLYDGNTKTIYINKHLKAKDRNQVLLHEIIHAVLDRIGTNQLQISRDANEIIAEQVSVFLIEAFNIKV